MLYRGDDDVLVAAGQRGAGLGFGIEVGAGAELHGLCPLRVLRQGEPGTHSNSRAILTAFRAEGFSNRSRVGPDRFSPAVTFR